MTEFWVSKAKHWCKYCRCWMNDSKMAIAKHEGGDRHKEAVARFVRNNREKKRHEEIEKAQVEKEMREIERKAREQFLTDVGIGAARFSPQVHVAPVNASGRMNVSSAFFPADANLRAQAPPPPPPKPTDRHPNESVFIPTPMQKTTTEDQALAEELAKEGIVLEIDEDAQEGQGMEGGSARARRKAPEIWWEYRPVEQDPDKEVEEMSKVRKPGSKAESKDAKVFGPFPTSQMVSWATEGYFSTGLGALVRKTTPCGTFKISAWEKTIDFDSYELEMLFNGQEMKDKKLLKMENERREAEEAAVAAVEEQEPIRVPQLEVGYGRWETVRIINVEEERKQNEFKVKLMESQQKKYYEQKVDDDSDEEHNVFSGIRDDEAEGLFKVEEEEEDTKEEIAKPGVVQFKRGREGKANSNKRNFRRKTTDSNDD